LTEYRQTADMTPGQDRNPDEPSMTGLQPVARADARLLILGSFPGRASLGAQRYYAHPRNQFWALLGHAIGEDLTAIDYPLRLDRLQDRRIALWDTVRRARRKGSLDSNVRTEELADVARLIDGLPQLRAVAFNGALAARTGLTLDLGAHLRAIPLPSSSPANTASLAFKQAEWDVLGTLL
jgi:TDG/mug DNA glycosylase family protein